MTCNDSHFYCIRQFFKLNIECCVFIYPQGGSRRQLYILEKGILICLEFFLFSSFKDLFILFVQVASTSGKTNLLQFAPLNHLAPTGIHFLAVKL